MPTSRGARSAHPRLRYRIVGTPPGQREEGTDGSKAGARVVPWPLAWPGRLVTGNDLALLLGHEESKGALVDAAADRANGAVPQEDVGDARVEGVEPPPP